MRWELSEEQKTLHDSAIKFARSALSGDMIERDRTDGFDREGWQRCAEASITNDLPCGICRENGMIAFRHTTVRK